MKKTTDILELFSALNNHEVFTPPGVARDMLDLLPVEVWSDPNYKFLDPCVKSGVFLREIQYRLFNGLAGLGIVIGFDGLQYDLNDQKQRMNHILKNMIFGIATSELTGYIARRTLYGVMEADTDKSDAALGSFIRSKDYELWSEAKHLDFVDRMIVNDYYDKSIFDDLNYEDFESEGNIYYPVYQVYMMSKESGSNEMEDKFFPFIRDDVEHIKIKEIINGKRFNVITGMDEGMKFDVIIGNPPYQVSDGGQGASAKPIYHLFIENAIKMNPKYISMITPSRWMTGGKGLDTFREKMLNDNRISYIVDFHNSKECFPSVDIKGGINYFLWDKNHHSDCMYLSVKDGLNSELISRNLNEEEIFIRDTKSLNILNKVRLLGENTMNNIVSSRKPFGFETNFKDYNINNDNNNNISIYARGEIGYIDRNKILINNELLNKYLVLIAEAAGSGNDDLVLGKPILTDINSCCTETYLIVNSFDDKLEAENLIKYIKTKFFRFFVSLIKTTQHGTKKVYAFVPDLPMTEEWTDEKLYERYNLTEDEITYIESKIREMK